jgi:HAD superfamily hydrolase (TIGR01450 family)
MASIGSKALVIDLKKKRLFLFDLDGVLLKGKERPVRIGGTRTVGRIRETRKKLFVLTNNSTDTIETVHSRLEEVGVPIRMDEILTSTRLTAEYASAKFGKASYFLIGEAGLQEELRRQGLTRTLGSEAELVVVGLDRRLTYRKLDAAVRAVRGGAEIVATHSAAMYMSRCGPALAVGPILRAIEYASGKKGVAIGKPSPLMFQIALEKAGCRREEAVMVGDQEDTDVRGAANAGIDSVLVLSGVADGRARTRAKMKIGNVDELAHFI